MVDLAIFGRSRYGEMVGRKGARVQQIGWKGESLRNNVSEQREGKGSPFGCPPSPPAKLPPIFH